MRVPVIIPARNEASVIGKTLKRFDCDIVEPIVVVNGSVDNTAEIARDFEGVSVYEQEAGGKLPAVQRVLDLLGKQALHPILYTDADSYPVSTDAWVSSMINALDFESPSAAAGLVSYVDGNIVANWLRSYRAHKACEYSARDNTTQFRGANMATRFHNYATLDKVLTLPHIWPGEDRAIEMAILEGGGKSTQVTDQASTIKTSSRNFLPLYTKFLMSPEERIRSHQQQYYDRAPDDSVPLDEQTAVTISNSI